jgi:hypothetical protein
MEDAAAEKYMHVCDADFTPPANERETILKVRGCGLCERKNQGWRAAATRCEELQELKRG